MHRFTLSLFLVGLLLLLACSRQLKTSSIKSHVQYEPVQEIVINTSEEVHISGTLNYVGSEQLVIIIAGSGPTDRDCNSAMGLKTNAFKMLADSLGSYGISSYRYDKRGVGKSSPVSESELVVQDFVADAAAMVEHFKDNFQEVTILGHSEGVLIGSLVAAQNKDVKSLIGVSGTSISLDSILLIQMAGYPSLLPEMRQHIAAIKQGKPLGEVTPFLQAIFRESVVPYLKSLFELDPLAAYAQVSQPVLTIGGKCDMQVPTWHAEALHEAHPNSTMLINDNMGHVMKALLLDCSNKLRAYNDTTMAVHSSVPVTIANFLAGEYAE